MGGEHLIKHLAQVAVHFGLYVGEWAGHSIVHPVHAPESYHCRHYPDGTGQAFDASGPERKMREFAHHVRRIHSHHVTEGIHNPGDGKPEHALSVKYGAQVPPSYWGSHT